MSEQEKILEEIEAEIEAAKGGNDGDFEIEITDDTQLKPERPQEEPVEAADDQEPDYGPKVQKRISKLVAQRREAEVQARQIQDQNAQLQKRLERLEQGSQQDAEQQFNAKYQQTKQALHKAVEEGDTDAQVNFQEQIADMRAAMRVAQATDQYRRQDVQRQQQRQQQQQPQRQQQQQGNPPPEKAMGWWQKNNWFNATGFERETAAARAIDVQLDLEGFDKNSDEYYSQLNGRLQKVFPELRSGPSPKQRPKGRSPVAPTTGGSSAYKGNRVRMTQEQLRMARELGINDERGLKKYEAEIRRQQREQ